MEHETTTTMFTMLYKVFSFSKVKQVYLLFGRKLLEVVVDLKWLVILPKTVFFRHAFTAESSFAALMRDRG